MAKRKQDGATPLGTPDKKSKQTEPSEQINALEAAYREALKAFKADKANKDLRRARSAAKKAWDDAVVEASGGGEPLTCRDCSQMFLFRDQEAYAEQGWVHRPTRCDSCDVKHKERYADRSKLDNNNGKNMCYEFQRTGECSRGDRCKFSHDQNHSGRKTPRLVPVCFAFRKGNCQYGEKCRFRHCLEVPPEDSNRK